MIHADIPNFDPNSDCGVVKLEIKGTKLQTYREVSTVIAFLMEQAPKLPGMPDNDGPDGPAGYVFDLIATQALAMYYDNVKAKKKKNRTASVEYSLLNKALEDFKDHDDNAKDKGSN